MQKRKFFIIIAIVIIISLLGLSATCLAPSETPTLVLEIYDGPDYSESDNMCYYRVEATATGMPDPEIEFNTDDNVNPLGSGRVEVSVEIGNSYTLTATATNSAGTTSVPISLKGDCGEDSPDEETVEEDADGDTDADGDDDANTDTDAEAPTIELEIYEGPFPVESICVYRVKAIVTGSPNPTIIFSKDDSGGSWGTKKAQVNLNNPGDTYTLTATATNSGGSATDSIELSWGCDEPESESEPESEENEATISANPDVSGIVEETGIVEPDDYVYVGDTPVDTQVKGYLSFDISGLHGKTVQDAEIKFISIIGHGEPGLFASEIVVKVFNYIRLDASDWAVGGVQLPSIPISAASYTISGNTLKNELQDVLDNEVRDYFQLKLGLNGTTSNNGNADGVHIECDNAILHISYDD